MEILSEFFNFSSYQFLIVIVAALVIGFSKTGIAGLTILVVPIMADAFGGKVSTGIMLPMLIVGDLMAVWRYHKHVNWQNIRKLMLWTVIGLALGLIIGKYINDSQFKATIAIIVIICLVILIYTERKGDQLQVPQKLWFYASTGVLAGFATMIGNAAGPIFTIYLLAMNFKKREYMGTNSVFFCIVNLIKVPLQIFIWHNISVKNLLLTGTILPFIAAGAILGFVVVNKINEKVFRYVIIILTTLASLKLLF